tara:strand:+ start:2865 stop:3068 length:204 start_codon:yes stop_codon:yes gene_type:complete
MLHTLLKKRIKATIQSKVKAKIKAEIKSKIKAEMKRKVSIVVDSYMMDKSPKQAYLKMLQLSKTCKS